MNNEPVIGAEQLIPTAIFGAMLIVFLPYIPRFFRDLSFYHRNGWNMRLESDTRVLIARQHGANILVFSCGSAEAAYRTELHRLCECCGIRSSPILFFPMDSPPMIRFVTC